MALVGGEGGGGDSRGPPISILIYTITFSMESILLTRLAAQMDSVVLTCAQC